MQEGRPLCENGKTVFGANVSREDIGRVFHRMCTGAECGEMRVFHSFHRVFHSFTQFLRRETKINGFFTSLPNFSKSGTRPKFWQKRKVKCAAYEKRKGLSHRGRACALRGDPQKRGKRSLRSARASLKNEMRMRFLRTFPLKKHRFFAAVRVASLCAKRSPFAPRKSGENPYRSGAFSLFYPLFSK